MPPVLALFAVLPQYLVGSKLPARAAAQTKRKPGKQSSTHHHTKPRSRKTTRWDGRYCRGDCGLGSEVVGEYYENEIEDIDLDED